MRSLPDSETLLLVLPKDEVLSTVAADALILAAQLIQPVPVKDFMGSTGTTAGWSVAMRNESTTKEGTQGAKAFPVQPGVTCSYESPLERALAFPFTLEECQKNAPSQDWKPVDIRFL